MHRFEPTVFTNALSSDSWPIGSENYAGWIPCVTGQLSFSMIGRADGQIGANFAVDAYPPKRFVAVLQKRQTTDLPYLKWLVRLFRPWSVSTYLLVASSRGLTKKSCNEPEEVADDIGVLAGKVYVFGHQTNYDSHGISQFRLSGIRKAILWHARPRTAKVEQAHADTLAQSLERRIRSLTRRGVPPLEIDIILFRTGEIRVSAEGLVRSPAVMRMKDDRRQKFVKSLLHQSYYFIKDAAHHHYHHDKEQDNILPLEKCSPDDDHHWRRETLWALTRAVLEKRRNPRLDSQKRAMGILSYSESFQQNLARSIRSRGSFKVEHEADFVAPYDFGHVRQSLLSTHDVNDWKEDSWRWRSGIAVTVFLALSAFLINVNELVEKNDMPATWVGAVLIRAASDPWMVVVASVAIFLAAADLFRVGFDELKSQKSFWEALTRSTAAGTARFLRKFTTEWSVPIAYSIQISSLLLFILGVGYLWVRVVAGSSL